ncbi:hypothetical protein IC006_1961 [Sulfuracidifex tepidarius]|uniref:Uncharacterized protein n=1 Tax=Sulfuracidifex tepidarius TaxID=1294262 RepID=A0A510E5U0_9CREN|nr:hypothetical protein IC006_1961 [Sulfuracidifex tepidarius]BBG27418.1 hypothetical protein IC007_1969 [Sulfuracidifex tepidarius]
MIEVGTFLFKKVNKTKKSELSLIIDFILLVPLRALC